MFINNNFQKLDTLLVLFIDPPYKKIEFQWAHPSYVGKGGTGGNTPLPGRPKKCSPSTKKIAKKEKIDKICCFFIKISKILAAKGGWLKEIFPPSFPPSRPNLPLPPTEGPKTTLPPEKNDQIPPGWPTPCPCMASVLLLSQQCPRLSLLLLKKVELKLSPFYLVLDSYSP